MSDDAGFLNDLALDRIEVNKELPEGTYKGFVFDSKVATKKDGSRSWVITYKVDMPDSPYHGMTKDEWKSINRTDNEDQKRFLKMRVLSLGVPEDQIGKFNPKDVVATPVFFTVKRKGEFVNVSEVRLAPEGEVNPGGGLAGVGATPNGNPPSGNGTSVASSMGLL